MIPLSTMGRDSHTIETAGTDEKLAFFLEAWRKVFVENDASPEETVAKYFSEDYEFFVNGHLLGFDEMVSRARRMRDEIDHASVTTIEWVGEGDKLAEIHEVDVVTKDGAASRVRLHNFLVFEGNKIKSVQSLTMNINGDPRHDDIASRH